MPAISRDERTVLEAFAREYRHGSDGLVSIDELVSSEAGRRGALRDALSKLADRGWLVVSTSLQWEGHHKCLLLGEGKLMAKEIASAMS